MPEPERGFEGGTKEKILEGGAQGFKCVEIAWQVAPSHLNRGICSEREGCFLHVTRWSPPGFTGCPQTGKVLSGSSVLHTPQAHHTHRNTHACTHTYITHTYAHAHTGTHADAHACIPRMCAYTFAAHTRARTHTCWKPNLSSLHLLLAWELPTTFSHTISNKLLSPGHLKTPVQESGCVKTHIKSFLRPILPLIQL